MCKEYNSMNINTYENMDMAVYIKDTQSRYLWANKFFIEKSAGLQSPGDIFNKRDVDFPWHDYANDLISNDNELFDTKKLMTVRERIQRFDGEYIDIVSKKSLLYRNHQELIGLIGFSIEIPASPLLRRLSVRERNVIILLSRGYSDKEIAKKWNISPRTVESFVNNSKIKLKVKTRAELIASMAGSP